MHTDRSSVVLAALRYFATVFATGFALALVRIPFLVPRFGERNAELIELPIMLAVILWAASRLVRRRPFASRLSRLLTGLVALALMVAAELAVGFATGSESVRQIIASRDPVSGTAYLVCLVVFGLAPAAWPAGRRVPGDRRRRK